MMLVAAIPVLAAAFSRARCFLRGRRARSCRALARDPLRVSRQRSLRRWPTALALERAFGCAGAFRGRPFTATSTPFCKIALRLALCSFSAALRRRQLYSGSTCFGEANSDRLLWRAGAVFTFSNVFHFFAHEFARLSAGRFAFALVFARAFNCFFFGHNRNVSPLAGRLDVEDRMGLALTRETQGTDR